MQIQARYTESLVRRTAMKFWVRYIGWRGFAAVAILAAAVAYLLIIGDSSWYVSVFGTVLVLAILFGSLIYFVNRHRTLATFRRMAEPTATFGFSNDAISTRSDLGSGEVSWRAITQIWTFPEAWLVFVAKGSYFTIPTESLTEEVRQFIHDKVHEHGGKVV